MVQPYIPFLIRKIDIFRRVGRREVWEKMREEIRIYYLKKKFIVRKLLKGCIYLQDQKRKDIFILKRKWSGNIDHS